MALCRKRREVKDRLRGSRPVGEHVVSVPSERKTGSTSRQMSRDLGSEHHENHNPDGNPPKSPRDMFLDGGPKTTLLVVRAREGTGKVGAGLSV